MTSQQTDGLGVVFYGSLVLTLLIWMVFMMAELYPKEKQLSIIKTEDCIYTVEGYDQMYIPTSERGLDYAMQFYDGITKYKANTYKEVCK